MSDYDTTNQVTPCYKADMFQFGEPEWIHAVMQSVLNIVNILPLCLSRWCECGVTRARACVLSVLGNGWFESPLDHLKIVVYVGIQRCVVGFSVFTKICKTNAAL